MKYMKKLTSLLLVLAMTFGLTTAAFADGTNTITVTNTVAGQRYDLYKILDLDVNADLSAYSYTVNSAWTDFFAEGAPGLTYVRIDSQGYVTWKDNADVAAFAKAAETFAASKPLTALDSQIAAEGTAELTFTGLEVGYYLITSTLGTKAIVATTPDNPTPSIAEKNEAPSNEKKVEEDSTNTYGPVNDADIGQAVNFTSTITAQPGAENYVFHDTMSEGLTPDFASIKIFAGNNELSSDHYTLVTSGLTDGCTFEIIFKQAYLNTITAATTLDVRYSAVLNEQAVIGSTGNPNISKLSYGDSSNTKYTPDSQTTTKTWEFQIFKYAKNTNEAEHPLSGARFTLSKNADGSNPIRLVKISAENAATHIYRVAQDNETGITEFESGASGTIQIQGLDADTYYLTETLPPAGYNQLASPIKVTIDHNGNVTKDEDTTVLADNMVKVENKSGTELPSTGGTGTIVFYVLGSVLVLTAFVALVTKRRMNVR